MAGRDAFQQAALDRRHEAFRSEGRLQDAEVPRIGPAQLQKGYAQTRIVAWRLRGLCLTGQEATV